MVLDGTLHKTYDGGLLVNDMWIVLKKYNLTNKEGYCWVFSQNNQILDKL